VLSKRNDGIMHSLLQIALGLNLPKCILTLCRGFKESTLSVFRQTISRVENQLVVQTQLLHPVQHECLGSTSPSTVANLSSGKTGQKDTRVHHCFSGLRHDLKKFGGDELRITVSIMGANDDLAFVCLENTFEDRVHILLFLSKQFNVLGGLWHVGRVEDVVDILISGLRLQGSMDFVPLLIVLHDGERGRISLDTLLELEDGISKPRSAWCRL
jgi:hypothetical protein